MKRCFVASRRGVVDVADAAEMEPRKPEPPLAGSLRLDVVAIPPGVAGGDFELRVYINDVEMTRIGAGLGMDPRDVLLPTNKLVAAAEPRVVPIARCDCGHHGCGGTDVTIIRRGDQVHWDWSGMTPIDRSVVFDAAEYDREVVRIASAAFDSLDRGACFS